VLVRFLPLWEKYLRKPTSREEWFILSRYQRSQSMVSGFCWFGAWGKTEYHGGEYKAEQSCLPHGGQEAKRQESTKVPTLPLRAHDDWWSMFLPVGPTSYWFYHLLTAPQGGDQAFNTWAFGEHSRSKLYQTSKNWENLSPLDWPYQKCLSPTPGVKGWELLLWRYAIEINSMVKHTHEWKEKTITLSVQKYPTRPGTGGSHL
jgi:hypothetical protein